MELLVFDNTKSSSVGREIQTTNTDLNFDFMVEVLCVTTEKVNGF